MVAHRAGILESLAQLVNMQGYGLEVSPYFQPVLGKDAYNVRYTDCIDNETIVQKASQNPGLNGAVVPKIDFVWQPGKTLKQCMNDHESFDFVIASHVMEHVPNTLGWLNEILETLKVGGRVALFLPNRKFNNDFHRKDTDFAQLLQWWIEQPIVPTVGQVLDFMSNSLSITAEDIVDWTKPEDVVRLKPHYSRSDIISTGVALYNDSPYIDAHCTVWTPESFRSVFREVESAGLIGAKVIDVVDDTVEFLVVLEKTGDPALTPPAKKSSGVGHSTGSVNLEGIEHRLGVMHHDLSFLIDRVHEAAGSTYRQEGLMQAAAQAQEQHRRRGWFARLFQ
ncbi:methyltransferase domain-containing protein [Sphingomonas sp. TREG-RG-20F-R18-01]|uniref:class I SAM-dependent methyltransferase n=1 Tax=Sphingomonas sp. TREG-RG-20F-R18-01 TaxID=2914982 RepID=UPI00322203F9